MIINKTMHDKVNQKRKKMLVYHRKKEKKIRPVLERPFK
jgi:hypothetical protein